MRAAWLAETVALSEAIQAVDRSLPLVRRAAMALFVVHGGAGLGLVVLSGLLWWWAGPEIWGFVAEPELSTLPIVPMVVFGAALTAVGWVQQYLGVAVAARTHLHRALSWSELMREVGRRWPALVGAGLRVVGTLLATSLAIGTAVGLSAAGAGAASAVGPAVLLPAILLGGLVSVAVVVMGVRWVLPLVLVLPCLAVEGASGADSVSRSRYLARGALLRVAVVTLIVLGILGAVDAGVGLVLGEIDIESIRPHEVRSRAPELMRRQWTDTAVTVLCSVPAWMLGSAVWTTLYFDRRGEVDGPT
jgi:hypothetical protein